MVTFLRGTPWQEVPQDRGEEGASSLPRTIKQARKGCSFPPPLLLRLSTTRRQQDNQRGKVWRSVKKCEVIVHHGVYMVILS